MQENQNTGTAPEQEKEQNTNTQQVNRPQQARPNVQQQRSNGQQMRTANGQPRPQYPNGQPRKRKGNRRKRALQRLGILVGTILAIFLIIFAMGASWGKSRGTKLTEDNILQQLSVLSTISETSYYYSNLVSFEDVDDFYGWDASDYSKLNISYDGKVTASIDPEKIKVVISGKNVTITLPEATVTSNEITENTIAVYNSNQGEFETITLTDFAGFESAQQPTAQSKATSNGLLYDAAAKAKAAAKSLVESLAGARKDSYQITIQ